MSRVDELKAELVVAEIEEKLLASKDTKRGPDRKLKQELREARLRYRAARDGLEVVKNDQGRLVAVGEVDTGDDDGGTARPTPARATARSNKTGGAK